MKTFVLACCTLLLLPGTNFVQGALPGQSSPTAAQIKFDPSTSLASRIAYPPEFVLQHYRDAPKPSPTFHELTEAEHAEVESVLQQLPAFSRKVFSQHVRSISFVDGPFGNGTTMMEDGSTLPVFDLVLRAGLLHENISELLTRKERNYYSIADSEITLSIEAGSLPAVLYILLHESVHVLDISNRAGKGGPPQLFANGPPGLLVQGIWEDARTPMPAYQSPLFKLSWFGSGKRASLDAAEPTYRMLAQTPFVSLYGSSNWYDDIAELVTCYDLTQRLHQPYRILLSRGHEVFYSLEPMNSPLVRGRFKTISTLFS